MLHLILSKQGRKSSTIQGPSPLKNHYDSIVLLPIHLVATKSVADLQVLVGWLLYSWLGRESMVSETYPRVNRPRGRIRTEYLLLLVLPKPPEYGWDKYENADWRCQDVFLPLLFSCPFMLISSYLTKGWW